MRGRDGTFRGPMTAEVLAAIAAQEERRVFERVDADLAPALAGALGEVALPE